MYFFKSFKNIEKPKRFEESQNSEPQRIEFFKFFKPKLRPLLFWKFWKNDGCNFSKNFKIFTKFKRFEEFQK